MKVLRKIFGAKKSKQVQYARDYVLNLLIRFSLYLATTAFVAGTGVHFIRHTKSNLNWISGLVGTVFFYWVYRLAQRGYSRVAANLLVGFYFLVFIFMVLLFGFDLPLVLLMAALITTTSCILLGNRNALYTVGLLLLVLIFAAYLQTHGVMQVDDSWRDRPALLVDTIMYSGVLVIIFIIAWIFNRQIEESTSKVLQSEAALRKERDVLEVRVQERTEELKRAQLEQMVSLQRFADMGRLAGGILHDLVNPVTALSMNLEGLYESSKKNPGHTEIEESIKNSAEQALQACSRIENFISAARRQLRNQDVVSEFSPQEELEEIGTTLSYKAMKAHVKVFFNVQNSIETFRGSAVKFYKVSQNLIANAIDSHDGSKRVHRWVKVSLEEVDKNYILTVADNGKGMSRQDVRKMFDPFFTTKALSEGTGIGLTIVKDIVEGDWTGKIEVSSVENAGTSVAVIIPKLVFEQKVKDAQG